MAKITLKGVKKLERSLQLRFDKFVGRLPNLQDELLDDLKDDIKSGKSPKTGKNFTKLAASTKENRRAMAKYNQTDASFSPDKSALTFSGQMVNSIKAKIKIGRRIITMLIEPTGRRRSYKNKDGTNRKGSAKIGNKKLAAIHSKGGANLPKREIIEFSKKTEAKVIDKIKDILLKALR